MTKSIDRTVAGPKSPFGAFNEAVAEINRVLEASIHGLTVVAHTPEIDTLIGRLSAPVLDRIPPEAAAFRFSKPEENVAFARREIAEDFPSLHHQAVIALWGALEVFIGDLAQSELQRHPALLKAEPFKKVKVSVADLEALGSEERLGFLIDAYSRQTGLEFKAGPDRLLGVLDAVGLGGAFSEQVKNDLWEFCQVRNSAVHRRLVADSRLLERCPTLPATAGERLKVTRNMYRRYWGAVTEVFLELLVRDLVLGGESRDTAHKMIRDVRAEADARRGQIPPSIEEPPTREG